MAQSFVLDCSVTMTWLDLESAKPSAKKYANACFDLFEQQVSAYVPNIWLYEVNNVLAILVRNKYISLIDAEHFISQLKVLPISISPENNYEWMSMRLLLTQEFGLSAYDAAYLGFAKVSGFKLATLDKKLANAAKKLELFLSLL